MRSASLFGRLCFRHTYKPAHLRLLRPHNLPFSTKASIWQKPKRKLPTAGPILLSALTPAAFIRLSEEDNGDGKTPEEHMLEASREELKHTIPDSVHGLRRLWKNVGFFVDEYIIEPMATGFRFLHLVIIFVPVILSVPAIWIGRRQKDRDNERSGTLWWYGFLVYSMERAGPAFIKVYKTFDQISMLS